MNKSADDGTTPLFVASQEGHTELVSLLIESGASVNLSRDDNASPLFIACHEGHLDVIHILMQVRGFSFCTSRGHHIPLKPIKGSHHFLIFCRRVVSYLSYPLHA